MITTGHLLVAGAIGVTASSVLSTYSPELSLWAVPLAVGLGILSHHLLDLVPHTDAATFWPDERQVPWFAILIVALENLGGLLLTATFFVNLNMSWAFLAGALGGVLPDLLDGIPLWQDRFQRTSIGAIWHRWHIHWHCADMARRWPMGLVVDALTVGGGLLYLLNVS